MKNKMKLFTGLALLVTLTTTGCVTTPSASTVTPSAPGTSTTTSTDTSSTGTTSSTGPISSTTTPDSSSATPISSSTAPISSSATPISSSAPISSSTTPIPSDVPENKTPLFTEFKQLNEFDHLTTTGDVNLLVIPVGFNDTTCSGGSGNCTTTKARIEEGFFGEGDGNGHESLSSFYKKSSYGKLNIQGEVTDVYQFPALTTFLAEGYQYGRYNQDLMFEALDNRLIAATSSFFGNGTTYNGVNYDNDGNGSVDGVWFVYLTDYNYTGSNSYTAAANDILWAFTSWPYGENAVYGSYCWASYNFFDEGGYSYPDSHTFVHETGHLLGLDDYYDYDGTSSPTGALDMMDCNILDHNAFSKYLMNWTTPTYINKSGTYQLDAFQEDGDFFLLGNNWNGSQFDQYIVVEYYTPTGLNTLDSSETYINGYKGFTENGIKIYLVDNRVGTIKFNSSWVGSWQGDYVDEFDASDFKYNSRTYIDLLYSNTPSYSYTSVQHPLIRLMEPNGSNRFITSNKGYATNASLFQQGDTFGSNFTLYGEEFPFTLTVGACTDSGATITVSAK